MFILQNRLSNLVIYLYMNIAKKQIFNIFINNI